MNRRNFITGTIATVVAGKVVADTPTPGKSDNRNPWSTGLYPIRERHLIVFDNHRKAQAAFRRPLLMATWDSPVIFKESQRTVLSKGKEYRYAVVRNIDEAYNHAGAEYRSITYECDIDPHVKEYLNTRVRWVA